MKKHSLLLLLLTSVSITHAYEKHDAHEHGAAKMNIVWEKNELNIEFLSPAFNITGFEHQPSNHEQEEAIEKIEKQLNLPNELFEFEDVSCKAENIQIESPFEIHSDHKDHDKHEDKKEHDEHDHAKHDDHKDHKDHDDHKEHADHDDHKSHDKHDDHAEDSSTHSEYSISYEFHCENSKPELTIKTADMFKHLPQLEKIQVQWLSAASQSSSILTKKNSTVTLK